MTRWRKPLWEAETGGETVDVGVLVLVAMDEPGDCMHMKVSGLVSGAGRGRTDALKALMGLAPGSGTETMIVMFPMSIFCMLRAG